MNRRGFIGGALVPLLPFPLLTACGSSSSSSAAAPVAAATTPPVDSQVAAAPPTPVVADVTAVLAATPPPAVAGGPVSSVPKPTVAYYAYSGNVVNSVTPFTATTSSGTTLVPDRLNAAFATRFADTASILSVAGLPAIDPGSFAASAWVRSTTREAMTVFTITAAGVPFVSLQSQNASGVVLTGVSPFNADSATQSAIGVTDGEWHHILIQGSTGKLAVYVDGFAARSYTLGTALSTLADVAINFGPWIGDIDDVRLYNRTFDTTTISLLVHRWVQVTPAAGYQTRDGAGLVSFGGQLWLLGGWNPDHAPVTNSEVWSSADGVNWSLQTTAPWPARHCAGWAVFDNKIWVVGGDNLGGSYQNDVWSSPDGINWTQVNTTPPWADRDLTMVAVLKDQLWLMGGCKVFEASGNVAYNDVYATTDGGVWVSKLAAAPWTPRGIMLGHVDLANRLWVIGGGTYDVRDFTNDVWSSADGIAWERSTGAAPWAARQYHSVATFAGKMWVVGGGTADSQGGTTDVWYSPNGVLWSQLPATPWPARHAASVCTHNGVVWLTCGSDTTTFNDVWQLNYAP